MSLGNIPCGMVGPDALADNVISAEFPDYDDKLFDANEFLNLNQVPDSDIGLNFHSRQD